MPPKDHAFLFLLTMTRLKRALLQDLCGIRRHLGYVRRASGKSVLVVDATGTTLLRGSWCSGMDLLRDVHRFKHTRMM